MKKRIIKKSIINFILIVVLSLIGNMSNVKAIDEMENLEQKRLELKDKINEAGKNLENISVELTDNLEAIAKLDEEIYKYEEKIETISKNIEQVEKQTKEVEDLLKELNKKYNFQTDTLKRRIVAWYETGKTRYIDVLLNSSSMTDFISKYYLISQVAQYDKDLLDKIELQKQQIERVENTLKISKENLKTIKTEQNKMAISLENAKVVRSSYMNKLSKQEQEIQENIETYQTELDLVEVEILMAALENSDSKYAGGNFSWPAPGYYTITSKYGMRLHPIIKTYCNHSGMDIGAPEGSYAIAANGGVVTKATYSYSYGNMVMINHGGGVTTLYAHGSKILVNVGDTVERGDPIMKVGSTGWSTGPHLHFEIRINGKTIDPYPYVTK